MRRLRVDSVKNMMCIKFGEFGKIFHIRIMPASCEPVELEAVPSIAFFDKNW